MLTAAQKSVFDEHGWVRVPRMLPETDVHSVLDRVWDDLEQRCGIPRDDPESWPEARPKGFNRLMRSGAFEPTYSQTVEDAINGFLEPGHWEKPRPWGALLLTFPAAGPWFLPSHSWHMDLQKAVDAESEQNPGVQVFAILEPLAAQGGATIALAGSHRLVRHLARQPGLIGEGRSKDITNAVKRAAPSLRDLWSRDLGGDRDSGVNREDRYLANPVDVSGIPVQAVEFTGEPGDVIFMHPWIIHAASPNCGNRPRIVITQRVYRQKGAQNNIQNDGDRNTNRPEKA